MNALQRLMVGAVVVTVAVPVAAQAQKPETVARAVFTELAARQFDKVAKRFGEPLKSQWPLDKMAPAWDGLVKEHGAFKGVNVTGVRDQKDRKVVHVNVVFERAVMDNTTVAVDPQGHITQLVLAQKKKPAGGD